MQVQKRDGTYESYDQEKIIRVVMAAGLSAIQAEILANSISKWLEQRKKDQVTSVQIRDRIVVEIQKIDRNVADEFVLHEKQRDKEIGDNI